MRKDTNYIVVFYGGKRNTYNSLVPHPLYNFIQNQIAFLSKSPKGIDHATFVFNESNHPKEKEYIDYLNQISLPMPHTVVHRKNEGFSYQAWEEVIAKTYEEYNYSFLIEDDYIPSRLDFLDYFKQATDEKTVFVASHFVRNHAAVSNGLFINKHTNPKNIFHLRRGDSRYTTAWHNQRYFMKSYLQSGYNCTDITKIGYTIFLSGWNSFKSYTDSNLPLLIEPYHYIRLEELTEHDLDFVLEVRNDPSTRSMLKTDTTFTKLECLRWFREQKPKWYIIYRGDEKVGYVRTDGNEVGCDIHPDFRRQGLARKAYEKYLIGKDYAELEVFDDNFAKKLYESLGFKPTGEFVMVRDRKYIKMTYHATVANP